MTTRQATSLEAGFKIVTHILLVLIGWLGIQAYDMMKELKTGQEDASRRLTRIETIMKLQAVLQPEDIEMPLEFSKADLTSGKPRQPTVQ